MSKGLEALENVCNKGCDYCDKWHYEHNLFCKRELGGCSKCVFCSNEKETIEKELKALEIIKEKMVDIPLLFETFNYYKNGLKAYNTMRTRGYELTQEEFDLLKEAFL